MNRPGDDDYFEEDEPVEEIFERFARGGGGVTALPPGGQAPDAGSALVRWQSADQAGGQAISTHGFIAIWPNAGRYAPDEEVLVQA